MQGYILFHKYQARTLGSRDTNDTVSLRLGNKSVDRGHLGKKNILEPEILKDTPYTHLKF